MAETLQVPPVKLIVAALFVQSENLAQAMELLEQQYGAVDYASDEFDFIAQHYYAAEMGLPIKRKIFSFAGLVDAAALAEIKLATNAIEQKLAHAGSRTVNLDSGYLDFDKLVLASMKRNAQKIYLGKGVWADMNLMYAKGSFTSFAWTFPDFAQGIYDKSLLRIREIYKTQWKKMRQNYGE